MEIPSLTAVATLTPEVAHPPTTPFTSAASLATATNLASLVAHATATQTAPPVIPARVDLPIAIRPHGLPPRGLFCPVVNRNDGLFGQMFSRPPAQFGASDAETMANLTKLGQKMSADPDPAKDGPDAEESGIPAAYTYFGQFIDHDLTFDPSSSLEKQNDPNALVDFRTPRFDMDNLYGRGPADQPYMYQADGVHFQLGTLLGGCNNNKNAQDLPRSPFAPNRALLGDPRNDENTIVSQLQGLWLRFHNMVADANKGKTFEQIQQEVRFHYQWIVVHDFLPKLINAAVLDAVLPGASSANPDWSKLNIKFYKPTKDLYMPVEFSGAAYRFGHSMIRPGYRLNDFTGPLKIFSTTDPDLRGFKPMPQSWAIDWRRFIDCEPLHAGTQTPTVDNIANNQQRCQLAYKIDTSLVNPLASLPASVASDPPPSLATRNLLRGWRLGLPSGQQVAAAMGFTPLADADIKIGQFAVDAKGNQDPTTIKGVITDPAIGGPAFKGNCPLWTYVLAETIQTQLPVQTTDVPNLKVDTRQLGHVGGTIVAEVFLGILHGDKYSYINMNPGWKPTVGVGAGGKFGLREMIGFVESH